MTTPAASERRTHPRIPVSVLGVLQSDREGQSAAVTIVDLSIGGVLMHSTARLDGTTDYTLRFTVGQTGIKTRVSLLRSSQNLGTCDSGCAFSEITPELQRLLQQIIDAAAQQVIPT